ncbi:hypothetical protein SLEP1_g15240 [Rubroshorea leprosula]|uniref:Uncharacterized protein n=1 Tax=Rubroshorea leprosula TaxID=152421 RepID=A0AAV5ILR2_9ROSI|nr:hypothetical protein SLEP1_g15240 [Rubroshorea leprosula]
MLAWCGFCWLEKKKRGILVCASFSKAEFYPISSWDLYM